MPDCSKVRTTGHFKGHPCGSPGLYLYKDAWTCANHFPIEEALEELARTKRALEIAMDGLKEIAFNEDPAAHWSFNVAACRLIAIEAPLFAVRNSAEGKK